MKDTATRLATRDELVSVLTRYGRNYGSPPNPPGPVNQSEVMSDVLEILADAAEIVSGYSKADVDEMIVSAAAALLAQRKASPSLAASQIARGIRADMEPYPGGSVVVVLSPAGFIEPDECPTSGHMVYRICVNGRTRPAYIGVTSNLRQRLRDHMWWMSDHNMAWIEYEEFETRRAAELAETAMIRSDHPFRNIADRLSPWSQA